MSEPQGKPVVEERRRGRPRGSGRYPPCRPAVFSASLSPEGRRRVAAILSVLAGEIRPKEAAEALGLKLSYYYALENRGYEGLGSAVDPVGRGRSSSPEREAAVFRRANARLSREVERLKAVLRVTQRAVGMAALSSKPGKGVEEGGRRKKGRRPVVRALRYLRAARAEPEASKASEAPSAASSASPGGAT